MDDGSSDATFEVLGAIERSAPEAVRVVRLPKNVGKGEAVRVGLTAAMNAGDELVGYADADLATPPEEVLRLFEALAEAPHLVAVIGSRINYLGTNIRRRPSRHYLGRVFATAAATALGREIYDTQCGAKVFRTGPLLAAALSLPFVSRWAFDVELLGRVFDGSPTRATDHPNSRCARGRTSAGPSFIPSQWSRLRPISCASHCDAASSASRSV